MTEMSDLLSPRMSVISPMATPVSGPSGTDASFPDLDLADTGVSSKDMEALQAQLKGKEDKIKHWKDEARNWKRQFRILEHKHKQLETIQNTGQSNTMSLYEELTEMREAFYNHWLNQKKTEDAVETLQDSLKTQHKKLMKVRKELFQRRRREDELVDKINSLQKTHKRQITSITSMIQMLPDSGDQTDASGVTDALNNEESTDESLNKRRDSIEKNTNVDPSQITQLTTKHRQQVEDLNISIADLKSQLSSKEIDIIQLQSDVERWSTAHDSIYDQFTAQQEDMSREKDRMESAEDWYRQKIDKLQDRINERDEQIGENTRHLMSLQSQMLSGSDGSAEKKPLVPYDSNKIRRYRSDSSDSDLPSSTDTDGGFHSHRSHSRHKKRKKGRASVRTKKKPLPDSDEEEQPKPVGRADKPRRRFSVSLMKALLGKHVQFDQDDGEATAEAEAVLLHYYHYLNNHGPIAAKKSAKVPRGYKDNDLPWLHQNDSASDSDDDDSPMTGAPNAQFRQRMFHRLTVGDEDDPATSHLVPKSMKKDDDETEYLEYLPYQPLQHTGPIPARTDGELPKWMRYQSAGPYGYGHGHEHEHDNHRQSSHRRKHKKKRAHHTADTSDGKGSLAGTEEDDDDGENESDEGGGFPTNKFKRNLQRKLSQTFSEQMLGELHSQLGGDIYSGSDYKTPEFKPIKARTEPPKTYGRYYDDDEEIADNESSEGDADIPMGPLTPAFRTKLSSAVRKHSFGHYAIDREDEVHYRTTVSSMHVESSPRKMEIQPRAVNIPRGDETPMSERGISTPSQREHFRLPSENTQAHERMPSKPPALGGGFAKSQAHGGGFHGHGGFHAMGGVQVTPDNDPSFYSFETAQGGDHHYQCTELILDGNVALHQPSQSSAILPPLSNAATGSMTGRSVGSLPTSPYGDKTRSEKMLPTVGHAQLSNTATQGSSYSNKQGGSNYIPQEMLTQALHKNNEEFSLKLNSLQQQIDQMNSQDSHSQSTIQTLQSELERTIQSKLTLIRSTAQEIDRLKQVIYALLNLKPEDYHRRNTIVRSALSQHH